VRGDIYEVSGSRHASGHEQRGRRHAIVVQSDDLMLSTVLVALTTTGSFVAAWHPEIDMDGTKVRVLVEKTGAVDVNRLGAFKGRVEPHEMAAIDNALNMVLGLDTRGRW